MKTLFCIFCILISITFITASVDAQVNNVRFNTPVFPDVMNKINMITEENTRSFITYTFDADSFPVFGGFPKIVSGNTIEGGIYCNMDSDSELEILYNIGYTVQAWNIDGSNVSGWPKTVSGYPLEGAPSFGDIDGDGEGEVVVTTRGATSGGSIYAFEKNGNNVTGFPVNHGYSSRTPVLADIDNDNKLEIIVNKRLYPVGEVWVYRGTGVVFPGWPKPINHVPASSAAVGDITGDGIPEIVMESYTALYVWKANGVSLAGFPFLMPNSDVNSYSSPVLADVDGDNIREIAFATHVTGGGGGWVYLLRNNGTILSGWPKFTPYWIYSPPSVGYIDNDNILDIAIGDGGGTISGTPVFKLYAWNKNGTALSGFPVGSLWAINAQVVLGDIDNDNLTELIIDDNTTQSGQGKYLAFNHDGSPVSGWPIYTTGTTFFSTPILGDLNLNNILDIGGSGTASSVTNVYLWNTQITFNPSRIFNPIWQYNTRHNGVYGDINLVGTEPISNEIPDEFKLYQNYPNPFNPVTKIRFSIPSLSPLYEKGEGGLITLKIFDILGREIATLINNKLNPGTYEIQWDATNYTSGVYFYHIVIHSDKLVSDSYSETRKMTLIK